MHEHKFVITDGNKKYCTCGEFIDASFASPVQDQTPSPQQEIPQPIEQPQGQAVDGLLEDPVEHTWQDLFKSHEQNGSTVDTKIAFIEQLLAEQQQQIVNRILDNLFKE